MKPFFIFLIISLLIFTPYVYSDFQLKYEAIKDNINVRVDSTVNSPSLGYLSKGEMIEVVGEKFEWFKIRLPERFRCYIAKDYLNILEDGKGEVSVSVLNIRAKPSLSSNIIGRLKRGEEITILNEENGWIEMSCYPYAWGWVHKKLVEISPEKYFFEFVRSQDNQKKRELLKISSALLSLLETTIPKLADKDIARKEELHLQLIDKGPQVIPYLESYVSSSQESVSYSIIFIFSEIGLRNPWIVPYFFSRIDSQNPLTASIYLDILQNILISEQELTPYFYLAKDSKLSERDIKEAKKHLKKIYDKLKDKEDY